MVEVGSPDARYPFRWAVFRWIEGTPYRPETLEDDEALADGLATVVLQLRSIDWTGAPRASRDRPLARLDGTVRERTAQVADEFEAGAVIEAWEVSLAAPVVEAPDVWSHADLLPPNLLHDESGRLCAVLDFGGAGRAHPAVDVIAAWACLGPRGRSLYRERLEVDEATWLRARGLALHQALMNVPYYRSTFPSFAEVGRRVIREVLRDAAASSASSTSP